VLRWLPVAAMTESSHAGSEGGGWGTVARAAPVCGESILGVGEEVGHWGGPP
jgi:hypothetical protein